MNSKPLTKADYTTDANGMTVFTREYLLKRGYCCRSGCRNCPYGFKKHIPGGGSPPQAPPRGQ